MTNTVQLHRHSGFHIRLGFVPLLDSAPLIMAHELGFFDAEGLAVELVKEGSWASIRDKVSFGLLDGAQMLAPMPLAMALADDRPSVPVVTGMVLSRNGNGVTLGNRLFDELADAGVSRSDPLGSARALIDLARSRGKPIQLASVAPWSSHDLQLRDWLATACDEAHHHVQIIPVSPDQMMDAFRADAIEGCCVGEPWNSLLEYRQLGRILHSGHQIWQNAPEKVLGMRGDWAGQHPTIHQRLIGALLKACRWLDDPDHQSALRKTLAREHYLGRQIEALDEHPFSLFHPLLNQHFFRQSANFPWLSQAHWLATRLVRWGQLQSVSTGALADIVQPELFRRAASAIGLDAPAIDGKTEGRHRRPFLLDGRHGPVNVASDSLLGEQLHDWRLGSAH